VIDGLLFRNEGDTLDFKRDQYKFVGEKNDHIKSELLKDILAMANSWGTGVRYIFIGIKENIPPPHDLHGLLASAHIDDATIQQFVNQKTNKPIRFRYEALEHEGENVALIRIEDQTSERPFYLKKDYGPLKEEAIYIRRGSSTDIAKPEEVAKMGRDSSGPVIRKPDLMLRWSEQVTLKRFNGHAIINTLIDEAKVHIVETKVHIVENNSSRGLNGYQDLGGRTVLYQGTTGFQSYIDDVEKYISLLEDVKGKHHSYFLCGGNALQRTGLTLTNNGNVSANEISFELNLPEWLKADFTAGGKNDLPSPPNIRESVVNQLYRAIPLSPMARLVEGQEGQIVLSDDKARLVGPTCPNVPHKREVELMPEFFLAPRPEAPSGITKIQYEIICEEYEDYQAGTLEIEVISS